MDDRTTIRRVVRYVPIVSRAQRLQVAGLAGVVAFLWSTIDLAGGEISAEISNIYEPNTVNIWLSIVVMRIYNHRDLIFPITVLVFFTFYFFLAKPLLIWLHEEVDDGAAQA
jgi:hypothetical protein